MLEFNFPELSDRDWLAPKLSASGKLGSEWAFGTLFIWKNTYYSKVCRLGESTLFCFSGPLHTYNMPLCEKSRLPEMMELMMADAAEKRIPFQLWGATKEQTEELEQLFPGRFRFVLDRNSSDYIYRSEDLIALSGRKFHGKRNHISQFERKYDWSYEDLTRENLEDCRLVAKQWCKDHGGCKDKDGFASEPCAIDRALNHFDELHLAGGMIRVEGKPVAFTVGEEINPKAYLLHFEKALDGYDGLYAVINHEYAAKHLEGYELINREEDMGIEGLRKAKLSYHPALLLERYRVALADKNGDAEK
ncbi:DUF2156 domain-containing protein [Caproicibacter fermentans]|uniref:DUF2156 domain-containing protein n=1 Tax=Caproicibacter fermentans TaxID=2576756 RepID=A0A7G8TCU5_9FIRM|nr:phosphatidylglycerol lysyltransferase domain-containing protein [Caproicibacter fermentans]QNK41436.1 DUF2156 domain-containing protein [Caproicibacter fermentans]